MKLTTVPVIQLELGGNVEDRLRAVQEKRRIRVWRRTTLAATWDTPQYCKIQHGEKVLKTCGFTPILLLVMMVVAWIATLRCKYIQIPLPRTGKYCLQGAVPVPTPWVPPLRGWSPMGRAPNFPHCQPGFGEQCLVSVVPKPNVAQIRKVFTPHCSSHWELSSW